MGGIRVLPQHTLLFEEIIDIIPHLRPHTSPRFPPRLMQKKSIIELADLWTGAGRPSRSAITIFPSRAACRTPSPPLIRFALPFFRTRLAASSDKRVVPNYLKAI